MSGVTCPVPPRPRASLTADERYLLETIESFEPDVRRAFLDLAWRERAEQEGRGRTGEQLRAEAGF